MSKNNRLTIGIPFKDRGIELSINLIGLLHQTYQDWDLIIYNDCHSNILEDNKTINSIFNLIKATGHDLKIIPGEKRGPHIGSQRILENATTELVLRIDDDIVLEPDAVEEMVKIFDTYENVGAVAPIYIDPYFPIENQWIDKTWSREYIEELCKVKWTENNELFLTGFAQINQHYDKTPIKSQHLNSGFMYRREAGIKARGYDLDLSLAGHREESSFSYRVFREGYNLYIVPSALAWHFHPMSGGIRETLGKQHSKENWDHDEKLFLERMEKWLPKNPQISNDIFVSVIILTYGDHKKIRDLLNDILTYTNHPSEFIIVNNDTSQESVKDFTEIIPKEYESLNAKYIQLPSEFSVSEARNIGTQYMSDNSKFICFIDDDARILGRYNQTTDWLDYLYNRFHEVPNCGAVSPIYTYFEELQCHCVSVACMFTSKKVWDCVGGFDPVFGNKEKGTWGWEDTDYSYRLESMGFKLIGVIGNDFPFYHHTT